MSMTIAVNSDNCAGKWWNSMCAVIVILLKGLCVDFREEMITERAHRHDR